MGIIFGIIGLVVGIAGAIVIQKSLLKQKADQLLKDAEKEGERLKKDKIIQAKEQFLKLKEEHESKIKDRERKLQSTEDRIRNKETSLTKKMEETSRIEKQFEKNQLALDGKISAYELKQQELEKMHQKTVAELSKISGMSAEDAKASLVESLKDEARTSAMSHINEIVEEAKLLSLIHI